jgi:hypothetical protein
MSFNRTAAKQAGYTDQEIDSYLQSKGVTPSPVTSPVTGTQPISTQPKKQGFLSSLVKPTVEAATGTLKNIGTVGQVGMSSLMRPFAPQAAARLASQTGKNPFVLNQDELNKISEKPGEAVRDQVKRSAIIASYAIPFGKGLTGAQVFTRGAAAGGLYGYGQKDSTPASVATSALLGGAFAWGTSKVADKILTKLGKTGEKMSAGKIKLSKKELSSPEFILKAEEKARIMKDLGLKGTAENKATQVANKYLDLTGQLDDAVKSINQPLQPQNYIDDALETSARQVDMNSSVVQKNAEFISNQIKSAKNWNDINTLKFQLQALIKKSYEGGALNDAGKVTKAFRDSLDTALKTASPEASGILSKMQDIHAIVPTLAAQVNQKNISAFPLVVGGVKLPGSNKFIQLMTDAFGRSMSKAAQTAPKALPQVGAHVASPLIDLIFGTKTQPQIPEQTIEGQPPVPDFLGNEEVLGAKSELPEKRVESIEITNKPKIKITEDQMMMILINPKIKSAIKNSVLQAYKLQQESNKTTNPKLTQTQMKDSSLVKTGQNAVKDVWRMYKDDPSVVAKQIVPGKFFSRQFDTAMFRAVDSMLRLRTGAVAPEQEIRRYVKSYAPYFGDTEEDVKYKLNSLYNDLENMKPTPGAAPEYSLPVGEEITDQY